MSESPVKKLTQEGRNTSRRFCILEIGELDVLLMDDRFRAMRLPAELMPEGCREGEWVQVSVLRQE